MEDQKFCGGCGLKKPQSEFGKHSLKTCGLQAHCKKCCSAQHKKWRAANTAKVVGYAKIHRPRETQRIRSEPAYKAKVMAAKRKYLESLPPEKKKEMTRKHRLCRKYGITLGDFDSMLATQGGRCAICRKLPEETRRKQLCVDHCHVTGKVRGLLCVACNLAIGRLGDNVEGLRVALLYLEGKNIKPFVFVA